MKKILSIILITACLACGCSSASDTEKNASKSTASEPESIDFFAMDTTIKFSAYGDKKVLKGAKKVLTDLEKKVSVTDSGSEIYHINQNGSGTLTGDVSNAEGTSNVYPDRRCTRHLYLPDRQGMGIYHR